jgi:hypothetical protein
MEKKSKKLLKEKVPLSILIDFYTDLRIKGINLKKILKSLKSLNPCKNHSSPVKPYCFKTSAGTPSQLFGRLPT